VLEQTAVDMKEDAEDGQPRCKIITFLTE